MGCDQDASQEELQLAFRNRARELHPDLNPSPDALGEFQRLVAAFKVLSDPDKRKAYEQRWRGALELHNEPAVYSSSSTKPFAGDGIAEKRAVQQARRSDLANSERERWRVANVRRQQPVPPQELRSTDSS
eukprot:CAMPEP_0119304012 /NCGR_PEP_ID=MMETSP1333-20130426/5336_1 /TAXON_ID=418940 /ORGANISM="Scyphosphaera apsteinii, Strain RCC1455" /LENGTH=130 /DNA_ID=CAMNT_0007306811 /DNA_START=170 /DNA_END=562 /DNA_ORIENTATION=+